MEIYDESRINPRALVIQKGLSLVSPPISSTYQPISGISSSVWALFEPFSNRDDLHVDLRWIFSILESFVSYGSVTNRRDPFHWYFLDQKFVSRYGNTYVRSTVDSKFIEARYWTSLIDINIYLLFFSLRKKFEKRSLLLFPRYLL